MSENAFPNTCMFLAVAILSSFVFGPAYAQPSFDCGKSVTNIEKQICTNDFLAKQDSLRAGIYRLFREILDERQSNQLLVSQRRWISERDKECLSLGSDSLDRCLGKYYSRRLMELRAKIQGFGSAEFEKTKILADSGNAHAQWLTGSMYYDGIGVQASAETGVTYWSKAEEHPLAQNNLAFIAQGAAHVSLAIKLLKRAADAGSVEAMNNLGLLFIDEDADLQDELAAYEWFLNAHMHGNPQGGMNLAVMTSGDHPVPNAEDDTLTLFKNSILEDGDPIPHKNVGESYRQGLGVPVNCVEARAAHETAAQLGEIFSKAILSEWDKRCSWLQHHINLVVADPETAKRYFLKTQNRTSLSYLALLLATKKDNQDDGLALSAVLRKAVEGLAGDDTGNTEP